MLAAGRFAVGIVAVLLTLFGGLPAFAGPLTTCTETNLLAAIAAGGVVTIECDGDITLTGPIQITNTVVIEATGADVRLVQTANARVFEVSATGSLTLTNVMVSGGRSAAGGGAIFNRGSVLLLSCVLSNNTTAAASGADGRDSGDGGTNGGDGHDGGNGRRTAGGAVFNLGIFTAVESGFFNNRATGGSGGTGGAGHEGEIIGGDGGDGGSGGPALGGAVYNAGRVEFYSCSFDANSAAGGDGAEGGALGDGAFPGVDGRGGKGAQAAGGALYCTNKSNALIVGSTFSANSVVGGNSASGGLSRNSGKAGPPGPTVFGGGVCNYGTAEILNSTFFENEIQGGNGGDGERAALRGGNGGAGGNAWGGNLFSGRATFVTNCTFFGGVATPGTNGVSGEGSFRGRNGALGHTRGANLSNGKGRVIINQTILANPPTSSSFMTNVTVTWVTNIIENLSGTTNADEVICTWVKVTRVGGPVVRDTVTCETNEITGINLVARTTITSTTNTSRVTLTDNRANAYGAIKDGGYNLISDLSIKFRRGSTSHGNKDPKLGPLAKNGGPTETLALLQGSPAIDAGSPTPILDTDQRGAHRPSGYAGDIGAFESDGVFEGAPVITTQPIDNSVNSGSNATFMVVASGSPPLAYQWYFGTNTALTGATAAVLTITNVDAGDAGNYYVVVSNGSGSITSSVVRLNISGAPVAVGGPADASVHVGENATLTFQTAGLPTPVFRWYFNGTNLVTNVISASLVLTNVQSSQAGTYHAIATNSFGSVTSRVATLTIDQSPFFVQSPPASTNVTAGGTLSLTAAVTGAQPMTFQWHFTNQSSQTAPIANATNLTLTITNFQATNEGNYTLQATNAFGSTFSSSTMVQLPGNAP